MGIIGTEIDRNTSHVLEPAAHGFMGRGGGISVGRYAGLNVGLGSDDDKADVLKNRQIAKEAVLHGSELMTVYQVHGTDVFHVTEKLPIEERPEADAMVTATPNIMLGILTADCVPVLFSDSRAKVVGAAHAGWRGLVAGVLENTIEAMIRLGAERGHISAAVGPCIGQRHYEVDKPFHKAVVGQDSEAKPYFSSGRADHYQFNLEAYTGHRLRRALLDHVDVLGLDTYADKSRFFQLPAGQSRRGWRLWSADFAYRFAAGLILPLPGRGFGGSNERTTHRTIRWSRGVHRNAIDSGTGVDERASMESRRIDHPDGDMVDDAGGAADCNCSIALSRAAGFRCDDGETGGQPILFSDIVPDPGWGVSGAGDRTGRASSAVGPRDHWHGGQEYMGNFARLHDRHRDPQHADFQHLVHADHGADRAGGAGGGRCEGW